MFLLSNNKKCFVPYVKMQLHMQCNCILWFNSLDQRFMAKKSNSKSWLSAGLGICSSVFLSELLIFCEWKSEVSNSLMVASLSWATWANRSGHYLKRSNCAKCDLGHSLLGIKRGKTVKNIWKIQIFWANRSFFASNLLESQANHSHRSF